MRGIDVSSHDGWPFKKATESAYQGSDFVIAKCTEGTGYLNPNFAKSMARAEGDGKLLGMYHYAKGKSAATEADYFMANAGAWRGRAVPVLDFESYGNAAASDPRWARRFCERVHEKWGVWPLVYTYASMLPKVAGCHPECALWVAGYPTDADGWKVPAFKYSIKPWKEWAVWQFTSGHETVDRNTSPLSAGQWRAMCGPRSTSTAKASTGKASTSSSAAKASTAYRVTASALNVRSRRSTVTGKVVGSLKRGARVDLVDVRRNAAGNTWGEVASGAYKGRYVAVRFKGATHAVRV